MPLPFRRHARQNQKLKSLERFVGSGAAAYQPKVKSAVRVKTGPSGGLAVCDGPACLALTA